MNVIVDTDALLGIYNPQDAHAERAFALAKELFTEEANVFLLTTTLAEFALLATSRIGMKETKHAIQKLSQPPYVLLETTENLTRTALDFYYRQTSKKDSLFDCYVAAAATKLHVDCIFSFDRGYIKNGFVLASDLLKK